MLYEPSIRSVSDLLRRQVVSEEQTAGGLEWGYALPGKPTGNNDEYIGYLVRTLE
jgi:cellobiose dehydrogenase (acceptor)